MPEPVCKVAAEPVEARGLVGAEHGLPCAGPCCGRPAGAAALQKLLHAFVTLPCGHRNRFKQQRLPVDRIESKYLPEP